MQFQILDPPTVQGSITGDLPSSYKNPSSDAVALLRAAIDGGNFVVELGALEIGDVNPIHYLFHYQLLNQIRCICAYSAQC